MKRFAQLLFVLCIVVACQKESNTSIGGNDDNSKPVEVASVSINKSQITIEEGQTEKLIVTVSPDNASDKSVSWKTSDVNVASIDNNGIITAVKAGSATISVTTANGSKTTSCLVTVTAKTIAVTGVVLDKEELAILKGETAQLQLTISPKEATNQEVIWTSDNDTIAKVKDGLVSALSEGITTINVITVDGSFKGQCRILVSRAPCPDEAVDMGLSVYWAKANIGAETADEAGNFFAWGDTRSYMTYFDWPGYVFATKGKGPENGYEMTKYCTAERYGKVDNLTTLESKDDVASIELGKHWRIPTKEEFLELIDNCTWSDVTPDPSHPLNTFMIAKSKINENSIVFPLYGSRYLGNGFLDTPSFNGVYWSSSLREYDSASDSGVYDAYCLYLHIGYPATGASLSAKRRCMGLLIRPVFD